MNKRLRTIKRIEHLQRRMHELSVWRLTALGQQRDQLSTAHAEILSAMSAGVLAFGSTAAAATRRIRTLEVEIESVKRAHRTQSRRALELGARSQLAGASLKAATEQSRRDRQSGELADLVVGMLRASGSASRKGEASG